MNLPIKKLTLAEQVRQAVRLERARRARARTLADLPPPGIDERVFADKSDGTLLSMFLRGIDGRLTLNIPSWALSTRGKDRLTVYKTLDGDQKLFEGDFDVNDADKFPLPVDNLYDTYNRWGEGPHEFVYEVLQANGGQLRSLPLLLRFDRVAPYAGSVPVQFPAIAPVVEGNINAVTLTLPPYPDWQAGDHVAYYWLSLDEPPEDLGGLEYVDYVKVEKLPQALVVPADYIRKTGNGGIFAIYQLVDKAGNLSFPSIYRTVGVALGDLPDNLLPPRVPLAPDAGKPSPIDDLIDVADALTGVTVEIDAFDNFEAEDLINVSWGSSKLGWDRIGSRTFPLEIAVPHAVLRTEYGMDTTGDKPTKVSYEVRRGTVPQGGGEVDILVNFEIIEPDPGTDPIPEWPDPVNPRLPLPDVYGEGAAIPNALLPEHENKDATLKVNLYQDIKADDVMEFYWRDQKIAEATYTITAGDNPGDEVTRPVLWKYIKDGNNGVVPVHYTVTRTGVPNIGLSGDQDVTVDAITIKPLAPDYERGPTAPPGWVNCASLFKDQDDPHPLEPAIRIVVPDLSEYGLKAGDVVSMQWKAFQGANDIPLPIADLPQDITLGDDFPVTGFTWYVQPYADHILPIYDPTDIDGSAQITYSFQYQGKRVESSVLIIIVGMHDANGPCPLPPKRK